MSFKRAERAPGAKVFIDEASAYQAMPFDHDAVNRSVGESVRGMAHGNGVESFWSVLKRGYQSTFHHMSAKHLDRYVTEFSGRYNDRDSDIIDQMSRIALGMVEKRLTYRDLVG